MLDWHVRRRFHLRVECSIRAGAVEDAEPISALMIALAEDFILKDFSEEGRAYFLGEHTPGKVRERLLSGHRFFLAEQDAGLAGVSALRGESHLYYLFVARPFHRRGVGRQLWNAVKEACLVSGYGGPVTVNSSAYAVPVYERFGFVRSGPPDMSRGVEHHPMVLNNLW